MASTHEDVAQVRPLGSTQTAPDWVEAELSPLYANDPLYANLINKDQSIQMGHTQFRLHFDGTTSNKQVGWNSGETVESDNPPQLIVRYQE